MNWDWKRALARPRQRIRRKPYYRFQVPRIFLTRAGNGAAPRSRRPRDSGVLASRSHRHLSTSPALLGRIRAARHRDRRKRNRAHLPAQLLAERAILDKIAFKGGACLCKLFIGNGGRFSTDLDFTRIEEHEHEDLIVDMMEAFE